MAKDGILSITARQILDSRGNPTVEADVLLADGTVGRAAVPSGASTGINEAVELRDGGKSFLGLGVSQAVANINNQITQAVVGMPASHQSEIDQTLIDLDGTPTKSKLGANAILAVSMAVARAAARSQGVALSSHFAQLAGLPEPTIMPVPMMNIINGGQHAAGSTDIQEFMIMPVGFSSFSQALQAGTEIFHSLKSVLAKAGYSTTVGDEGGFAPTVTKGNVEALSLIAAAVKAAGYKLGKDVYLALDVASSELRTKDGQYRLERENRTLSSEQMIDWYTDLLKEQPIISIEDGLGEDDWSGWQEMTKRLGATTQLVGDDLFVTNTSFLKRGIDEKAGNAILIKLNQIGTVTETIQAVAMAREAGWNAIISHRSGETEDTTIADLVVGLGTGQIKTGSLSRTDRVAKYNQLLRLEEELGEKAVYAGRAILKS